MVSGGCRGVLYNDFLERHKMTTITIPPGSNLDPYLMANRINTRFILGPGSYRLGTGWAFDKDHDHCCLGFDCELVGAGRRET